MILSRFPDKNKFLQLAESYDAVPVCVQILADTHTPVSLFGRFYEDPRGLLLAGSRRPYCRHGSSEVLLRAAVFGLAAYAVALGLLYVSRQAGLLDWIR